MSATATRPFMYAGSEIAPVLRSSFGRVAAWKRPFSAITVPDVPLGIRFFATSTGVGAVESLTLERYWTRYAIRRIAASTAAAIPRTSVQPREFETLVVREVLDTSLLRSWCYRVRTTRQMLTSPGSHCAVGLAGPLVSTSLMK